MAQTIASLPRSQCKREAWESPSLCAVFSNCTHAPDGSQVTKTRPCRPEKQGKELNLTINRLHRLQPDRPK